MLGCELPVVADGAPVLRISKSGCDLHDRRKDELGTTRHRRGVALCPLAAAIALTAAPSLLPADPPADPEARLALVVDAFLEVILRTEAQQRTMLRFALDPEGDPTELPLRQGRAITWLTEALEPLRPQLGDHRLHQLVLAIRATTGIEALVWLVDVAGLTSEAAAQLMSWSALALYRAALTPDGAPP
jgi:hypothetical protein